MAAHLREALAWCREVGLSAAVNKTKAILPETARDFVRHFNDGTPPRLQHILSHHFSKLQYAKLHASMSVADRVRFECCTHHYAGLWLTTLPSNPSLRLTDPEMRIAVCLRTGVVPYFFDKHGAPVKCPSAGRGHNACDNVDMRTEWFHRIHCVFENKLGRDRMHNKILAKLLQLCALFKLHAEKSPKGFTSVDQSGKKTDRKQPDGLVYFTDNSNGTIFDVRTVDPLSSSALNANKHNSHKYSDDAANDKTAKYLKIADGKNCDIQPVVITTLGGFHKSAVDFVHKILKNASGPNKSQLFFAKMSELSIALMKDNASIVQKAFGLA
jgi:hypothetical protein